VQSGLFTMPAHPAGRDWRRSRKQNRASIPVADEVGFAGVAMRQTAATNKERVE